MSENQLGKHLGTKLDAKLAQVDAKLVQDGPKTGQDGLKMGQDSPKIAQVRTLMGFGGAQGGSKAHWELKESHWLCHEVSNFGAPGPA